MSPLYGSLPWRRRGTLSRDGIGDFLPVGGLEVPTTERIPLITNDQKAGQPTTCRWLGSLPVEGRTLQPAEGWTTYNLQTHRTSSRQGWPANSKRSYGHEFQCPSANHWDKTKLGCLATTVWSTGRHLYHGGLARDQPPTGPTIQPTVEVFDMGIGPRVYVSETGFGVGNPSIDEPHVNLGMTLYLPG
uniref:Uncharacterized protein n=1 Tax=Cannabis sativa TaxID=3483 RepID=A0A803PAL1_CANSA